MEPWGLPHHEMTLSSRAERHQGKDKFKKRPRRRWARTAASEVGPPPVGRPLPVR